VIIIGCADDTTTIIPVVLTIKRFVNILDMNDRDEIQSLLFFWFLWLLLDIAIFSIIGI
jgi:hypothetical protein